MCRPFRVGFVSPSRLSMCRLQQERVGPCWCKAPRQHSLYVALVGSPENSQVPLLYIATSLPLDTVWFSMVWMNPVRYHFALSRLRFGYWALLDISCLVWILGRPGGRCSWLGPCMHEALCIHSLLIQFGTQKQFKFSRSWFRFRSTRMCCTACVSLYFWGAFVGAFLYSIGTLGISVSLFWNL